MRIVITAQGEADLAMLARAGVLDGSQILYREPPKRRQLSRHNQSVLIARLAELRRYKAQFGSFEVPQSGQHAALGDWLDKLRETYVKAPDGYRIEYLKEHAPDLLEYLKDWASSKVTKVPAKNAPFWLSAAWVADFMGANLCAPSQASIRPDEVAMAKWLSRWTSAAALKKLNKDPAALEVARELDALAQLLRSRDAQQVAKGRQRVREWMTKGLYRRIAAMCAEDDRWMTPARLQRHQEGVESGARFWPTWAEWKREASVWLAPTKP